MSSVVDEIEDRVMLSELRRSSSNRKPDGTLVNMLTAYEVSKDSESKQSLPNVVAKLMGLDMLPQLESDSPAHRIESKLYSEHSLSYSEHSHSEIPLGYWHDERSFFNKKIDCEVHSHVEQNKYKDIYEILQQSHRTSSKRDKSPQKRSNDNVNEKMLAFIRQKFMEAKCLAMDEKLQRTKEFQDALDVLSTHGDLFLKVLQEPNTLISQHLYLEESIYSSPKTKSITILRPLKMASDDKLGVLLAKRNENKVKKQVCLKHGFPPSISSWKVSDSPIQPTRIVVLKPSPSKANETKGCISLTSSSPRVLTYENIIEEPKDEEAREAGEVAKEITQQLRENLAGHRRDESLLSSVLSNGYTEDDSSFEKSENEFAAENLNNSEVMSPASRHSWDYVSRYDSPFSSFNRAFYSPESSVCREAKKRLSERWAMMASNGNNKSLDQQHLQRSSTTLGEMLGLHEVKRSEICEEENDEGQDPRASNSGLNSNMGTRKGSSDSPKNLLKSKSVLVSSSAYGERLNVKVASAAHCNVEISKENLKAKTSKTSFTRKVTSLFFSRNKKFRKEKPSKLFCNNESQLATTKVPRLPAPFASTSNDCLEAVSSPTSKSLDETALTNVNDLRLEQSICSPQQGAPLLQGENQEQPSPISVLDPQFEEDDSAIILPNRHAHMPLCIGKSNLIDKFPSGTIARTLSWDESFIETDTNYYSNSPFMSPAAEDDEVAYIYLVQSLLKMAGIDEKGEMVSSLTRWHSLDSPLDPRMKDKYIDLSAKEPLREAKRRHLRSSRKLIFDCVNAALVDITGFGTPASCWYKPYASHNKRYLPAMELADKVWAWMKELLSDEVMYISMDGGDNHRLVERLVRNEVAGKGWIEQINLQVDSIGNEIGGKLLEDLLEESVVEWTGI